MDKIRSAWGHPKTESFHFERIGNFAALTERKGFHQLSKQSQQDIDICELFIFIDRTNSKVGQQYLFKKLIQPAITTEGLHLLNERANLFTGNVVLREEIQAELTRLNTNNAYYIASLLHDNLLERPPWFKFLPINILAIVILLVLSFNYPVLLIALIFPLAANMLLHIWNKINTYQFFKSFPQLSLLIDVSDGISKKDSQLRNTGVKESIAILRPFQWKLRLISLDGSIKDDLNQIGFYLIELVKAFLLIEVYTLFHLTRELETKKESILTLFNYVGDIDVAISVASLRAGAQKTCIPYFTEEKKELLLKNIYHPLIQNCTKNDLYIRGNSVLITGSNMSGKTTFLRTIFINSILAQTL